MNLVLYRVLEYLQSLFPTFSLTMPLETLPSEILLQIVSCKLACPRSAPRHASYLMPETQQDKLMEDQT
jgi:hypothetical protein